MTEERLVKECLQHNPEAERELFSRFAPRILTICRRYARDDQEAHDFLQESFLMVFDKLNLYQSQKGKLFPWMHRVSVNVILMILRRRKKDLPVVYLEDLNQINESEEENIPQYHPEVLLAAIQKLPEGYREVFNLYFFEEWTHKQISNQLNISESTSRSQLARARRLLKELVKKTPNVNYERRLA